MTAQTTKPLTSFQVLDATGLKLLAAGLMLLDHIHQMFADAGAPVWLSMLGRLVFPIFLFAASESFHYTHSRKNYLLRLLLADCGMVLFTTVLQTVLPNEHVVLLNNAFSTFVVAGIWMLAWDELTAGVQAGKVRQILKAVLWGLLPILGALPVLAAAYWAGQGVLSGSLLQILVTIGLMIPNVLTLRGRGGHGGAGRGVLYPAPVAALADGPAGSAVGCGLAAGQRVPVDDGICRAAAGSLQRQAGPGLQVFLLSLLPAAHRHPVCAVGPLLCRLGKRQEILPQ